MGTLPVEGAAGAAGAAATDPPDKVKPQPVFPASFPTAGPEQTAKVGPFPAPGRPAQQVDAQSALEVH